MLPSSPSAATALSDVQKAQSPARNATKSGLLSSTFGGSPRNALNSSAGCNFMQFPENERFSNSTNNVVLEKSVASMVSFDSSSDEGPGVSRSSEQTGAKIDVVYSLLSMLSSHDRLQSSEMLLTISQDRENCSLIRQSGCLSLLIQLLHPFDIMPLPAPVGDELQVIQRASEALKNMVRFDDDEGRQRRDSFILLLVEHVRNYVLHLRLLLASSGAYKPEFCEQAYTAMGTLTKLSYDEEQRRSMCFLGALHCIAEALVLDQKIFSNNCPPINLDFRRFIGMTLTNLTYGASETKRVLCSNNHFLDTLNAQMISQPEELRQVFAGVLRNLSWKTDASSKIALREAGTVVTLMRSAMEVQKEATLKSILSALWNLSAHCSENKAKICAVPSALEFLISTLVYKSTSRSMAVVESGGGILRNISSHLALKEEYRAILRQLNCFQILLEHLQSPSLTIVSNACGTLWNLSAHSVVDQKALWQMGAEKKLRNLVHSKHKMISLGSAATLKNLLAGRPKDSDTQMKMQLSKTPTQNETDEIKSISSSHYDPTLSSMVDGRQTMATTSTVEMSTTHRRQTPTMEIAAMLSDVTKPVVKKAAIPIFRVPVVPPLSTTRMQTSQPVGEASINATAAPMQSSIVSTSSSLTNSKIDKIELDKAAVHRFHSSLRRNSNQPFVSMGDDQQLPGAAYGYDGFPRPPPQQFSIPSFPAGTTFATSIPQKDMVPNPFTLVSSKQGLPEKQVSIDGISNFPRNYQIQQRPMIRKPSGSTTPADFKSEPSSRGSKSVTAMTPLMYSRQSSLESLDSCDQHSVRSTVYSEYSQLPTGIPSPSELPDSPTNTLPMMIGERKLQQEKNFNTENPINSEARSAMLEDRTQMCMMDRYLGSTMDAYGGDERPKVYATQLDKDPNEKLDQFGKIAMEKQGTVLEPKLSASSSLSALTIDSDMKHTPMELTDRNCFGHPSNNARNVFQDGPQFANSNKMDNMGRELQECILAAKPSPKAHGDICKGSRSQSTGKPRTKAAPSKEAEMVNRDESAAEMDLQYVMQSAMPKPKANRSKIHNSPNLRVRGKNVAIVRATRPANATTTPQNLANNTQPSSANEEHFTTESNQPADHLRAESIMERSDELLECIALALPKPKSMQTRKSKSLDRNSQRRDLTIAFSNTMDQRGNATCEHGDSPASLSRSGVFMNNAATAERVKDASVLFEGASTTDIRLPPVARVAPEPQVGSNLKPAPKCLQPANAPNQESDGVVSGNPDSNDHHVNQRSCNDDSLSEDNYSRIIDDSFVIEPEDVDVDFERENEFPDPKIDQFLSPTELLIDCETFCSPRSTETAGNQGRPAILKGPRIKENDDMKIVRGGQRHVQTHLASTLAAPKLAVRMTKATELRAKKTLQCNSNVAGNSRSRSMSPATNSPAFTLTTHRIVDPVTSTASSPTRSRRYSGNASQTSSPLATARSTGTKCEDNQLRIGSPSNPSAAEKTRKRELGSNVRKKIESLQKKESASEDDSTTSPLVKLKSNDEKGSPKAPSRTPTKTQKDNQGMRSQSKEKDVKRALVTTV